MPTYGLTTSYHITTHPHSGDGNSTSSPTVGPPSDPTNDPTDDPTDDSTGDSNGDSTGNMLEQHACVCVFLVPFSRKYNHIHVYTYRFRGVHRISQRGVWP